MRGRQDGATCTALRARWTGEIRQPKAGEWYLSGAVVEAYLASDQLSSRFHIAEIVKVRMVTLTEVVEVLS
jgi:hypothetical protein